MYSIWSGLVFTVSLGEVVVIQFVQWEALKDLHILGFYAILDNISLIYMPQFYLLYAKVLFMHGLLSLYFKETLSFVMVAWKSS